MRFRQCRREKTFEEKKKTLPMLGHRTAISLGGKEIDVEDATKAYVGGRKVSTAEVTRRGRTQKE